MSPGDDDDDDARPNTTSRDEVLRRLRRRLPELLTTAEAASLFRVCTKTIRRRHQDGEFSGSFKMGSHDGAPLRFPRDGVIAYVQRHGSDVLEPSSLEQASVARQSTPLGSESESTVLGSDEVSTNTKRRGRRRVSSPSHPPRVPGESRQRSAAVPKRRPDFRRFKKELEDMLHSFSWDIVATATFRLQGERRPIPLHRREVALSKAIEEWSRWIGWPRRLTSKDRGLRVYVGWERHESGEFHAHLLVGNLPEGMSATRAIAIGKRILHNRLGLSVIREFQADCAEAEIDYVLKHVRPGQDPAPSWHGPGTA